jgi:di/tricarboxylate transporter
MTPDIALLLTLIVLAVLLFISEKLRPDLIAILVLLSLALTNLVTPAQAFSGLSSPAVILLISVYMMTGALFRTGVSASIGRWLVRAAGDHEARMVALVMTAASGLSLFMNNIAAGAVLMPAIMDVIRRTKINPSKIMLPMAYATELGGMATLLTTANIVVNNLLQQAGYRPFRLTDFIGVGGLAAVAGIAYMVTIGRHFLPERHPSEELTSSPGPGQRTEAIDLATFYGLKERLHEITILPHSRLSGQALENTGIGSQLSLTVMAIKRNSHILLSPSQHEVLHSGDVLLISGRDEMVEHMAAWGTQVRLADQRSELPISGGTEMLEVLPAPHSSLLGKSIKELQFRSKYGLNVIAMWVKGRAYRTAFSDFPLHGSEVLLVYGPKNEFERLQNEPDWLVLRVGGTQSLHMEKRLPALFILAVSLIVASLGVLPIHLVMFTGALAMVLTGCLMMEEAYRSIDWRSVILVGGMLPVGIALTNTGAAHLIGNAITSLLGSYGPLAVVAGLFLATSGLNQFIPGGSTVPAVLTPIAIAAAINLGADPHPFALVVAIASGTSMLTPFAHPVNVLVMGPGGYRFTDYLRSGLPLVVITLLVVLITLPIFWRL